MTSPLSGTNPVPLPTLRLPPRSTPAASRLGETQRSFASALGRAGTVPPTAPQGPAERARDAAEQYVAQTLVLPLLKQLRESNHAAPPFAPSQAQKQFAALQDAETAQRIAHASRFPLVDRLARDLLRRSGVDASGRDAVRELASAPTVPLPNPGVTLLAGPR